MKKQNSKQPENAQPSKTGANGSVTQNDKQARQNMSKDSLRK